MKKSTINRLLSIATSLKKTAENLENIIIELASEYDELDVKIEKKIKYSDRVSLFKREHDLLVNTFGDRPTAEMIAILDAYKQENNRHYKNDMGAIRNWVISAWGKRNGKDVSPAMLKVDAYEPTEQTIPSVDLSDDFDVPPEQ